jgi:hypothetical protein
MEQEVQVKAVTEIQVQNDGCLDQIADGSCVLMCVVGKKKRNQK